MSFHNRRWIFLDSENISGVNFNQVQETSAETVRYSADSGTFFVKYNVVEYPVDPTGANVDASGNTWQFYYDTGVEPPVITGSGELYPSGYEAGRPDCYDLAEEISGKIEWHHEEMLEYLSTPEWTPTGIM